jgi:hypothetical protein
MMSYLWTNQVYLKNFGDHVEKVTQRVKEASLAAAKAGRRPVQYLNSSQLDKETIARNILAQDGVRNGLVCVLSCIEPCWKFEIHRNRMTKKPELKLGPGKCLFLYHYPGYNSEWLTISVTCLPSERCEQLARISRTHLW